VSLELTSLSAVEKLKTLGPSTRRYYLRTGLGSDAGADAGVCRCIPHRLGSSGKGRGGIKTCNMRCREPKSKATDQKCHFTFRYFYRFFFKKHRCCVAYVSSLKLTGAHLSFTDMRLGGVGGGGASWLAAGMRGVMHGGQQSRSLVSSLLESLTQLQLSTLHDLQKGRARQRSAKLCGTDLGGVWNLEYPKSRKKLRKLRVSETVVGEPKVAHKHG
jgi:hypothetical protein